MWGGKKGMTQVSCVCNWMVPINWIKWSILEFIPTWLLNQGGRTWKINLSQLLGDVNILWLWKPWAVNALSQDYHSISFHIYFQWVPLVKEWAENADAPEWMKKGNPTNRQVVVPWNQKKRKFQEGGVRCFSGSYEVEDWGKTFGLSISEDLADSSESCFIKEVVGGKPQIIVDWGVLFPFFKLGDIWVCLIVEANEMREGERYKVKRGRFMEWGLRGIQEAWLGIQKVRRN